MHSWHEVTAFFRLRLSACHFSDTTERITTKFGVGQHMRIVVGRIPPPLLLPTLRQV
jgi:hypothetical protein